MKNVGIVLLVVFCLYSCKEDDELKSYNRDSITEISYIFQGPIGNGSIFIGSQNSLIINEVNKIASLPGYDFSGNPTIVTCSQEMMDWDKVVNLVDLNSYLIPDDIRVSSTINVIEKIIIIRDGISYSVDFESEEDLGANEELMLELRAQFQSMNGCQ